MMQEESVIGRDVACALCNDQIIAEASICCACRDSRLCFVCGTSGFSMCLACLDGSQTHHTQPSAGSQAQQDKGGQQKICGCKGMDWLVCPICDDILCATCHHGICLKCSKKSLVPKCDTIEQGLITCSCGDLSIGVCPHCDELFCRQCTGFCVACVSKLQETSRTDTASILKIQNPGSEESSSESPDEKRAKIERTRCYEEGCLEPGKQYLVLLNRVALFCSNHTTYKRCHFCTYGPFPTIKSGVLISHGRKRHACTNCFERIQTGVTAILLRMRRAGGAVIQKDIVRKIIRLLELK